MDSSIEAKFKVLINKKQHFNLCLVISEVNIIKNVIETLNHMFQDRIQLAIILKNGQFVVQYKDFFKIDNEVDSKIIKANDCFESYECAYRNLNWDSDNTILIDISQEKSANETSIAYRRKLHNNFRIDIFELDSKEFEKILQDLKITAEAANCKTEESKAVILQRNVSYSNKGQYSSKKDVQDAKCFECTCKTIDDDCSCFNKSRNIQVTIDEEPFEQGTSMYCFSGIEVTAESLIPKVFKMFKVNLEKKEKEKEAKLCVRIQHISKILAKEYRKENPNLIISFNELKFIEIQSEKKEIYLMDEFLNGDYMKFSNNEFAKFGDHYDLIEFSHWTYDRTSKKMMIVDLQGLEIETKKVYQLTDPAIHSDDRTFGKTDFGPTGFNRYMLTHIEDCRHRKKSVKEDLNKEKDDHIEKYSCKNCDTYLTNKNELRMDGLVFQKKKANLFRIVKNVEHAIPANEYTTSGYRWIAKTRCKGCKTVLGFHYQPDDFDRKKADCTLLAIDFLKITK